MFRKVKRALSLVLMLSLVLSFAPFMVAENAYAADSYITVNVTGKYMQSDARTMLNMIKDYTGEAVEYDYTLEEIAMERAMEVILSLENTDTDVIRPNGESFRTVIIDGYHSSSEYAAPLFVKDAETAQQAFDYHLSDSIASLVGAGYSCLGIAHVETTNHYYLNGETIKNHPYSETGHIWVIEFSRKHGPNGKKKTTAVNTYETRAIDVAKDKIVFQDMLLQRNPLEIKIGESVYTDEMAVTRIKLDTAFPSADIRLNYRMGNEVEVLTGERAVTLEDSFRFGTPSTSGILGFDLVKFTGLNAGTTKIKVTSEALGTSKTLTVKVLPTPISETTVSGIKASYNETGKAIKPIPKVVHNGETLVKGVDYTVSYSNNINAGTALVKIAGKGNYSGTVTKKFTIKHVHTYGEWTRWDVARHVRYCSMNESHREFGDHDWDNGVVTKEATERATGIKTLTCSVCGTTKTETIPRLAHSHNLVKTPSKAATCTARGNTTYWTCKGCGKIFSDSRGTVEISLADTRIDPIDHDFGGWHRINDTQHERVCTRNETHKEIKQHRWDDGKVLTEPTEKKDGVRVYYCIDCKAAKTEKIDKLPKAPTKTLRRAYGDGRYDTSFAVADTFLLDSGKVKNTEILASQDRPATLDSIIVACGDNFPDALAASYLAKVKNAPVIVWREKDNIRIQEYIKSNLKPGKRVYIMGGKGAVGSSIANGLTGYKFTRLGGENRYETNVKILNAAQVTGGEILVCDGTNFENALIASATGKPILLVKPGGVTREGLDFVRGLNNPRFTIIGGNSSVSSTVETQLKSYGAVTRIGGTTADQVSVNVAKYYFTNPRKVVLATASTFPDGLCGGVLAIKNKAPLMLVTESSHSKAAAYTKTLKNLEGVTVLGGTGAVSDALAKKLLNSTGEIDTIKLYRKVDNTLDIKKE